MRRTTSSGPGGSARSPFAGDRAGRRQGRRVDVEGVLRHPGGVPRRMVESGEVVVVELDLGTLHHPVAQPDEDVLDLAHGPDQQVAGADRDRRRPGQGHVHRVPASPSASSPASSSARRASAPARAPGGPGCPPSRPGPRWSAGSSAIPRRICVSSAFRPRYRTRSSSSAAVVERGGDRRLALAPNLLDPFADLRHGRPSYRGRYPLQRDRSRHRGVQRLGPPARIGILTRTSTPDRPRPAAPRARRRRRSPPAPSSSAASRLAAVRDQRGPRPARSPRFARAAGRGEDRPHARPHRLRRVGIGALRAQHHRAADQRVGRADDRADVSRDRQTPCR